jgi:asparagine synthase (glutamine-hydrolysing)
MVFRPKEGFVLPVNGWLAGKLEDYVRQTLSLTALGNHGLFKPQAVQRLLDDFYAGRAPVAAKILNLLAFQEWFSLYRPSIPTLAGRHAA